MTTRQQVAAGSAAVALAGIALLTYLLMAVPPTLPNGDVNSAALVLFLLGLLAAVGGVGCLIALATHKRWPVLAGVRSRRGKPSPSVAVRQGLLAAVAAGVLALLAYTKLLDIAFVVVTVVLLGLLEAFLQSRQH